MQRLSHPNIVGSKIHFAKRGNQLCIVMTYCDGGSKRTCETAVPHGALSGGPGIELVCTDKSWPTCYAREQYIAQGSKTQNIFLLAGRFVLGDLGISKVPRAPWTLQKLALVPVLHVSRTVQEPTI